MSERKYRCIGIFDKMLRGNASIQVQSPTGNTVGFYLHLPPVCELEGEQKIQFFEIVASVRIATEAREKWEEENQPKDTKDIGACAAYNKLVKETHPRGLRHAYVDLTLEDLTLLKQLHDKKLGKTG